MSCCIRCSAERSAELTNALLCRLMKKTRTRTGFSKCLKTPSKANCGRGGVVQTQWPSCSERFWTEFSICAPSKRIGSCVCLTTCTSKTCGRRGTPPRYFWSFTSTWHAFKAIAQPSSLAGGADLRRTHTELAAVQAEANRFSLALMSIKQDLEREGRTCKSRSCAGSLKPQLVASQEYNNVAEERAAMQCHLSLIHI